MRIAITKGIGLRGRKLLEGVTRFKRSLHSVRDASPLGGGGITRNGYMLRSTCYRFGGPGWSLAAIPASLLLTATAPQLNAVTRQDASITLRPIATVSQTGGPHSEPFNVVEDAIIDSRQRIYVLDSRLQTITVLNARGVVIQYLGGPGRRDAGLFVPRALAIDSRSTLYVLDRAAQSIVVFAWLRADSLRFVRRLNIGFEGSDLCMVGDRLYALGLHEGHLVHELNVQTGSTIVSFGTPRGGDDANLNEALARGYLSCTNDVRSAAVAVLPNLLPELRFYSLEGAVRWIHSVANYQSLRIERRQDTLFFGMPKTGYYNAAAGLLQLNSEWLLMQIGRKTVNTAERGQFDSIRTTIISAVSGRTLFEVNSIPRISGISHGLAVSIDNGPRPAVRIFQFAITSGHERE